MTAQKRGRPKGSANQQLCEAVRELGREGLNITEAAKRLGVPYSTLLYYERVYPAFREAFAGIRKNSEHEKRWRYYGLLTKNERQLLLALARVREKRKTERTRLERELAKVSGVKMIRARDVQSG